MVTSRLRCPREGEGGPVQIEGEFKAEGAAVQQLCKGGVLGVSEERGRGCVLAGGGGVGEGACPAGYLFPHKDKELSLQKMMG